MDTSHLPLYPKSSSIYNKLLQLVIAVALIVVLLNLWMTSNYSSKKTINDHFYTLAEQHLVQSLSAVITLELIEDIDKLSKFVDGIAAADWIYDVHIYDATGKILAVSTKSTSIKDIYGITLNKTNKSHEYVPFIHEIRDEDMLGFMRITVKKGVFIKALNKTNDENHTMIRLMMLIAVFIGFLLTRGLSRFSRQGFRLPVEK